MFPLSLNLIRLASRSTIPLGLRLNPASLLSCHHNHQPIRSYASYQNRYTHFKLAYPGPPRRFYSFYVSGLFSLLFFLFLGGGVYLDTLEASYIKRRQEREKKKSSITKVECQSLVVDNTGVQVEDEVTVVIKKPRIGFRDRRFIAYEDRIRAYSTPDKIFRYFATLRVVEDDCEVIYMTPDDFVRAITPGIRQPEGLDLDSFKKYDPKTKMTFFGNKSEKLELGLSKDSLFYTLCNDALITFSDFVFLLTVLSTPRRQFEIAFHMFDLNGDGELDANEFDVVRTIIMDTTPMGRRHRDHSTTGSTLKRHSNSALHQYFFGVKGDKKLTISAFLDFHAKLKEEIMRLEFVRECPEGDKMTELQFAKYLLTYTRFSEQKRRKMLRRIKQKFPSDEESQGISYSEFYKFNLFLHCIGDVDTALTFYHMSGAPIDQATLGHVARTVADVSVSPHVIDVVFTLFDENNDGHLSYREFVGSMKNRMLRGLDKPMDTGFIRLLDALVQCTKEQLPFIGSAAGGSHGNK